jgi:3-hydroxybutyryl-CoA dehydrogenase
MNRIGIVGAGTMGSGIALTALLEDVPVVLQDSTPDVRQRAWDYITHHLNRKKKAINIKYLEMTGELEALNGCQLVIEAITEDLSLKQDLFARLDAVCPPPAILATNTSTLSVTAIASAVADRGRVAGLHFFNPAAVMPLVEVVRGAGSSPSTLETLVHLAEKLRKTAVITGDSPGFIVNRVARPWYGEALRLLSEGAATPAQIDFLARNGGGFRMGPFELMDLIGIDVNLAATQAMFEQTYGEPRYRPHWIQAQMVAQKALGRKTGRGFYTYPRQDDETATQQLRKGVSGKAKALVASQSPGKLGALVWAAGSWAPGLAELSQAAGFRLVAPDDLPEAEVLLGVATAGRAEGLRERLISLDAAMPPDLPLLCQCADVTLAEASGWLRHPARLVGFDGMFFSNGSVVTLVANRWLTERVRARVEEFLAWLGRFGVWIADVPGLVLPRLVCMVANEAAFATGEGVADPATLDLAMRLGMNFPRGPLAWAAEIGYAQCSAVLLHLLYEYGEDRYRLAPWLRQQARLSFNRRHDLDSLPPPG